MAKTNIKDWKITETELLPVRPIGGAVPPDGYSRVVNDLRKDAEMVLRSGHSWIDPITGVSHEVQCRAFTKAMGKVLARIWVATHRDTNLFVRSADLEVTGGDHGRLIRYELVEEGKMPDGTPIPRTWRITAMGDQFCKGHITVPRYMLIFAGKDVGYVDNDEIFFKDVQPHDLKLEDLET